MTTFVSSQADSKVQPVKHSFSGVVQSSLGFYTIGTAPVANDLYSMSRLPANCLVIGGECWLSGALETGVGSSTLDIDLGWADNGGASATITDSRGVTWTNMLNGSANAVGFGDFGVFNMAVVTNIVAAARGYRPYDMSAGPVFFSAETVVQAKCIAIANTYASGTLYTRTDFIVIG